MTYDTNLRDLHTIMDHSVLEEQESKVAAIEQAVEKIGRFLGVGVGDAFKMRGSR